VNDFRRNGRDFIDLTVSNPTDCGIVYPADEIMASLARLPSLHYEPDPKGLSSARDAVATYYWLKGVRVDANDIILTASTSESYSMIFKLLCEPADEILVPVPSYPLFEFLAQLNDVIIKPYQLRYDGEWHIDMSSIEKGISKRTKAIIVVSPHNPTGTFLKESELTDISTRCAAPGISVIVDEVFADYAFNEHPGRVVSTAGFSEVLTFTLNGISKLAGLPQMKLGWMAVSGPEGRKGEALSRLEIVGDTFLSVNTPVQVALPQFFEIGNSVRAGIRNRVSGNRLTLEQLGGRYSPWTLFGSEGGWNAIIQVPRTKTGEEWALSLLGDVGVYTHPGYFFEFQEDNVLVLSLLARPTEFREGATRLRDYIHEH
jgi:alanine-synthesizing transaminase